MAGSSPRAWGTRPLPLRKGRILRFIPTCVGNAISASRRLFAYPVHPHVRGERGLPICDVLLIYGSSPRAWGTPSLSVVSMLRSRFIPTCVGNACFDKASKIELSVHPHVRGERPETNRHIGIESRFIPTCVGNASNR